MSAIGDRIRRARFDAEDGEGYTQADLADKIGVQTPKISRWENGHAELSADELARLEQVLGPLGESGAAEESSAEEDEDYSWPPMEETVGSKIRNIKLFDPHDEDQIEEISGFADVYMFYAGNNDWIQSDKIKLVGAPEYIGSSRDVGNRVKQWKSSGVWWWRKDWIDLGVCI